MASKITYENKVGLENDETIIRKNKVVDEDMNEIKQVVNNHADNIEQLQNNKVDKINGKGLSTNDYTTAEKSKLAGIATNANNYIHPASHAATMIAQDSTHRFVSDTEKQTWNAKANTDVATTVANGLMSKEDKAKLNDLENYDDTDITQDIEKLQQENTYLRELNSSLQETVLDGQTSASENIIVNDSVQGFGRMNVHGGQYQEKRSGKNKIDLAKTDIKTLNGITSIYNANENSITFNGTCTQDNTLFNIAGEIDAIKNQTTLSLYYESGTCNEGGYGAIRLYDEAWGQNISASITDLSSSNKIKSITYSGSSTKLVNWSFRFNEGTVLNNLKIKAMLTNNVDTKYEMFGIAPSIDFSSDIKTVGDNINVFDKDNVELVFGSSSNYEILDEGIKAKCTNTAQNVACVFKLLDVSKMEGKKFKLSGEWIESAANKGQMGIGICNEDGTKRAINEPRLTVSGNSTIYIIPQITDDKKYLAVWIYANANGTANVDDYVIYKNIKVAQGDRIGAYSKYGQGNVTINVTNEDNSLKNTYIMPIQQEMLEGDCFEKIDGVWYEKHIWEKYVFTGQESWVLRNTLINTLNEEIRLFSLSNAFEYKLNDKEKCAYSNCYDILGKVSGFESMKNKAVGISFYYKSDNLSRTVYINDEISKTVNDFKAKLAEKEIYVWYETEIPKLLECTEEQRRILDKINTYKNTTIITTDDDLAKISLKYKVDVLKAIENATTVAEQEV